MRQFLLLITLSFTTQLFAQNYNIDSISHLDYGVMHNSQLNDCWGYVDETGIEYALVGGTEGTSVVSLADPANPVEVFWKPGSNSVWRDLKVYNDYAYITTEADDGLLIIDLSPLPASNVLQTTFYFGPSGNTWNRAHNIFIDTVGGWGYICGANRGNGGLIILDIHTDPLNPIEVGEFDDWYCHDAFAQGNLLYGAHIDNGFFSIIDVTDHTNPVLLNTQLTSSTFTHNIWVTSNDQYAVTTDEVSNAFLDFFDVSDPMNILPTDLIQSSPGELIVPHNAFIENDTIVYTSYYTDGVTVHDMSNPENVVQIGAFDTNPLQNNTMNGCWGVYPFLPSGYIIATDRTNGMFVLKPQLVQPCYFEGLVRNATSLVPISNVDIEIIGSAQPGTTDFSGEFAIGDVNSGIHQIVFNKVAFEPDTISYNFMTGEIIYDTIDLVPLIPLNYTVHVQDATTGDPIIDADVRIAVPILEIDAVTDGFGDASTQVYYHGINRLTVGKWGYKTQCVDTNLMTDNGTIVVQLTQGYFDDFSFDFGWSTYGIATQGLWERGKPYVTSNFVTPQADADMDCNNYCFLTGNEETLDPTGDDVANGFVGLRSPIFNLTGYTDPYLYYERFFFNYYGPAEFDDELVISIQDANNIYQIDITEDSVFNAQWEPVSIRLLDYLSSLGTTNRISIKTSDYDSTNNVTEAGFDHFMITEGSVLTVKANQAPDFSMAPNPSFGSVHLTGILPNEKVFIYSAMGELVFEGLPGNEIMNIDLGHLNAGFYHVSHAGKVKKLVIQ